MKKKRAKKQQGIALLVLVIVLALTISAYYFSTISVIDVQVNNLDKTRLALKQAKQALIDYAVTHADGSGSGDPGEFGYLPCPHISSVTEGAQDPNCKERYKNTIGYLPWNALDTDVLRDGSGNCLWYAVSSSYKNSPDSLLVNEDSNGMFQLLDEIGVTVVGNTPDDRVIAVVFAPGPPLANQNRNIDATTSCGDDAANISAYLEGNGIVDNANIQDVIDTVDQFISASVTSHTEAVPYNDHLITITRDEIWSAIMTRTDFNNKMQNLTEALALCLKNYAIANSYNRLPWPALIDLADYRLQDNYDDSDGSTGYAGRYPYIVADSNTAITAGSNDVLFDQGGCDPAGGISVDLKTAGSEYRNLWNNWKDHFFYVVSRDFSPAAVTASCGDCITVNANQKAAMVIYAGSRQAAQLRTGQVGPDIDTKNDITNYIENGNEILFPDITGNGAYVTGGNDIMYCIDAAMGVAAC